MKIQAHNNKLSNSIQNQLKNYHQLYLAISTGLFVNSENTKKKIVNKKQ